MPYPGGKGRMFQQLISLMPPHRVYIETHLGGGAVLRRKRPAEVNIAIDSDPKVIADWQRDLPAHVDLILGDAVAFLEAYRFSGDELSTATHHIFQERAEEPKYIVSDYREKDHVRLLSCLLETRCRIMISGYESALYNRALSGWRRIDFPMVPKGETMETVWLNYEPSRNLHDHNYIGADFREREAVKRRRRGLIRRVLELAPAERNALVAELAVHDPDSFKSLTDTGRGRRAQTPLPTQGKCLPKVSPVLEIVVLEEAPGLEMFERELDWPPPRDVLRPAQGAPACSRCLWKRRSALR